MVRPGHISLCPATCTVRHDSTLLALASCADNKHFDDCGLLKTALYSKLKQGWNPHTAINDPTPDFRYPLIHWASALGKAEALQWLIKMRLKPSMQCRETGECPLHYAVKMLYRIRSIEQMPIDRMCNRFSLILKALTDHEPNVLFLGDLKGNSVFHTCAINIAQQQGISAELEFYENCFKHLMDCVQGIWNLRVWNNTVDASNTQSLVSSALNSQNDEGNAVLHILAQSDFSNKSVLYIVETFSEEINKQIKNNDDMTPAEVAVSCGANRIAASLGVYPESSTENLHKKLPSVFQLYTQDTCDPADLQDFQDNGDLDSTLDCTEATQNYCNGDEAINNERDTKYKKPDLRLNSYIQRPGFYCGNTSQDEDVILCDADDWPDENSQQDPASSPSLLSCETSNSFPKTNLDSFDVLRATDKSEELNKVLLTESQDSQLSVEACLDGQSCCDSPQYTVYESDVTEDESPPSKDDCKTVNLVSNAPVCHTSATTRSNKNHLVTDRNTKDLLLRSRLVSSTLNSEPSSVQATNTSGITKPSEDCEHLETDGPRMCPRLPRPACVAATMAQTVTERNEQNQGLDIKPNLDSLVHSNDTAASNEYCPTITNGTGSTLTVTSSHRTPTALREATTSTSDGEFASPLIKFIKEEFDVASLVRAKLLDRKEKSRSELCEIQQHFHEQEQKVHEESNRLQQMQVELDSLKASRQTNTERKRALVQELKMVEEATIAMEMRSAELERIIADHTQRKQSLHKDREDLNRQCDVIKRRVEEYEGALIEISSTEESRKKPKREPLGD